VALSVFLVDDASSDGTSEEVRSEFPGVRLIPGDGDLYWSGGMRLAEESAVETDPDFLLWLNDDVTLYPGAIEKLLETHRGLAARAKVDAVVIGAMIDPDTLLTSYSGLVRANRLRRMRFDMVEPGEVPVEVETGNGNLVLISRAVYRAVGPIDSRFVHKMSDFDYGLRARQRGFEVWLAPGHLGGCTRNGPEQPWLERSDALSARVNLLLSPKGLPPREWWRFVCHHGGVLAPLLFVTPYARFLSSILVSPNPEVAGRQTSRRDRVRRTQTPRPRSGKGRGGRRPIGALRVLHVLDVLRPSGAEVMLELAAPLWSGHGIEPQLLSVAAAPGPFWDRLTSVGYQIHRLSPTPRRTMLRQFARLLDAEDIDVVHLHVERANFWFGAIARAHGLSVVSTSHGNFPFTGALRVERIVHRALGRQIGIRYVSVGQSVAGNERTRFFNRTTVISNWCDLKRFRPPSAAERVEARQQLGIQAEAAVVSVGNCAEVKNHELLLRALGECKDLDYLYLHAGDDSCATGLQEVELAHELGLAERIRFLGQVDDVPKLLYAADVFVGSSLCEGFPVAPVEALACGLRLVLTDVVGHSDLCSFDEGIRFVAPEPSAMARAIRSAAGDASLRDATVPPSRLSDSLRASLAPSEGVARYARIYQSAQESAANARGHDRWVTPDQPRRLDQPQSPAAATEY